MSGDQQSIAKSTQALEDRGDNAVPPKLAPLVYWNPCQGIPAIVIASPRLFFTGQAIVVILCVAVVLLLFIF